MTTKTKTLAALLSVAVVLSAGAYAVGTQTAGGGALASSGSAPANTSAGATNIAATGAARRAFRAGPGRAGFADLAQRLGVSTAALGNALRAIGDEKTPAQRRTEITAALAAALGKSADDVTRALDAVLPARPDHRGPRARGDVAAALAQALGVDQAKVQAGLDRARRDLGQRRGNGGGRRFDRGRFEDAIVDDIASATAVDAAKVRSALQALRPDRGSRHDRRDDIRQKLATALGVTTDGLQTAIQKVATDQRDAFATELARKLNIDPAKVRDALPDVRGPGFGFGLGFGGRHHG